MLARLSPPPPKPRRARFWRDIGPRLRGPQFLLDDQAARYIEAFLNQARLVLIGCLLVLANRGFMPGSTPELIVELIAGGLAWFLVVQLLIGHLYRPWVAIAIALVDVAFITALIHWTGGPLSSLDALYPIVVFAAIIRFTRVHSFLFTLTAIAAYVTVTIGDPLYNPESHAQELLTRAVILTATGFLAWLIAAEVARQRRSIAEAQQHLHSLQTIGHIAETVGGALGREEIASAAARLVEHLVGPKAIVATLLDRSGQLQVAANLGATETLPLQEAESDAAPTPLTIADALRSTGCGEVIEVPLARGAEVFRWLFVGAAGDDPLGPADRALVQRLTEETASALLRVDLLDRERERARSLALMAEENGRLLENERQTVARLRQLASHKDSFIDMIAHELRTPLTSIKGFAQLLSRSPSASGGRYTDFILAESNRLMDIIDDIVDLSLMERGLLEMNWQAVDVAGLLREIAALAHPADVRVAVELPPELPRVRGDPDKLRQTFVNLVHTGARHHNTQAPMSLAATSDGSHVEIRLDVEGQVLAQRLAQVFDRVPSEEEPAQRAGLGLYICKNFVEAHGGRLWLEHSDQRARFVLRLPVDRPPGEEDTGIDNPTIARPSAFTRGAQRRY